MKKVLIRIISIAPAVFLQVLFWLAILTIFKDWTHIFIVILNVLAILFVLYLVIKRDEPSYKILWLVLMLEVPIFGAWLFLFFGNKKTMKPLLERMRITNKNIKYNGKTNEKILKEIEDEDKRTYQILNLISEKSKFPIIYNKETNYYPLGDDAFPAMLNELRKAEKTIFIEYFIIENGKFWNSIVEILKEKLKKGVDCRVIFDDFGSISTYSPKNVSELNQAGIKCMPFNPLRFVRATLNNRDHRKMMIIDNKVAFSGGINLADEYINEVQKYGHWKDVVYKITGDAVNSFTYMFLEFWNIYSKPKDRLEQNTLLSKLENKDYDNGYVLSYYDSPGNEFEISNNLFIDLLAKSKEIAWFYTPYLILGENLTDAFIRAAQRGVDVKIITPGIPDKKIISRLTKSYYRPLIEAGVKIYEYTPGFIHAKASIIDNDICTIGTVNLDYRSLFLNFECNSVFYKSSIYNDLKKDYEETLKKCKRINKKDLKNFIFDGVLRLFAPLC